MLIILEGGYNLKSKKLYDTNMPVLSIVTVVYNSEQFIERTIKSVLAQSYRNIEHIILDGNSKDNTVKIIQSYEQDIAYWKSESDKGIYDAMNKAQKFATGDYIMFLNSGDEFCDNFVVEKIFKTGISADAYYGDTIITDELGNPIKSRRLRPPKQLKWSDLRYGMLVCHQSIIIKKSLSEEYNINYRIAADIDWAIRSLKKCKTINNVKIPISKFMEGGMSTQHHRKGLEERFKILSSHFGLIPNVFTHLYFVVRIIAQKILR